MHSNPGIVLLFTVSCCLLVDWHSNGGAEIHFRRQSDVSGAIVVLSDIADIIAAENEDLGSLNRTELFPAPGINQSRAVRVIEIRQLLRLQGIPVTSHTFRGPATIRITHRPLAEMPSKPAGTAEPSSLEPIVIARRPIAAGAMVREADVELRPAERPLGGVQPARTLDQVIGVEAARSIGEGQPLDLRFVRKPLLVARGQMVSVVAKSAGVQARTTARALEGGSRGDLILLESLETKGRISAVVTGAQQAEVLAGGISVSDRRAGRRDSFPKHGDRPGPVEARKPDQPLPHRR
jgi:flagella basal body P-ring formation protein FlgA